MSSAGIDKAQRILDNGRHMPIYPFNTPHPISQARHMLWRGALCACLLALLTACRAAPAAPLAAIGDSIDVDGWRITVHSIALIPPDAHRIPAPGNVFLTIELTLENRSDTIRFFMPEKQMALVDGAGAEYAPDPTAAVAVARRQQWVAPDGELSSGEVAHGAASYQVPATATDLHWVFRSSLLPASRTVTFLIGELPATAEE